MKPTTTSSHSTPQQPPVSLSRRHPLRHRLLAVFLMLILFCSTFLGANFGLAEVKASNPIDSGAWGDNITWDFDGSTLTFTGQGAMQDAPITTSGISITIHTPWGARFRNEIKRIVIGEGITHVGKANFSTYFQNLETVVLPNSLISIGDFAFEHSKKLHAINYPPNLKTIGAFAFTGCGKLKNPYLPNSITNIGESAFGSCSGIMSITIPQNMKTVNNSFSNCVNLTSVKLHNNVKKIGEGAFGSCIKLKSIDIPSSVTSIGFRAFNYCEKLSSIKIRNRNCKISMINECTIPQKTVIYGYKGSPAEKYAKKFGNKFKSLSGSNSSKTIKVKKLKITNAPKKLKAGKSKTLKVKVAPSNATKKSVTWKSSNKKYATISSKGKVTAKKAGKGKTVKITAIAKDSSKKKASVNITIQ